MVTEQLAVSFTNSKPILAQHSSSSIPSLRSFADLHLTTKVRCLLTCLMRKSSHTTAHKYGSSNRRNRHSSGLHCSGMDNYSGQQTPEVLALHHHRNSIQPALLKHSCSCSVNIRLCIVRWCQGMLSQSGRSAVPHSGQKHCNSPCSCTSLH